MENMFQITNYNYNILNIITAFSAYKNHLNEAAEEEQQHRAQAQTQTHRNARAGINFRFGHYKTAVNKRMVKEKQQQRKKKP